MPKSPEEWLKEVDTAQRPAVFKLFLGYAPGVGKTYAMLSEGVRRASRGEEVVIGVVETHGRKPIVELSSRLESVPRKKLEYKSTIFEEMDVDAILARKPHVVLVDELAHTNIEGSKHAKRYEDVFELLDAGIDVLSTLNVQHIESLCADDPQPDRGAGAGDGAGLGDSPRGRDCDGGSHSASAANAHEARRYLSARASRARAGKFLPQYKPGGAARAGPAAGDASGRPHAFGTQE